MKKNIFLENLQNHNIPITEEQLKHQINQTTQENHLNITNLSTYSPFWKIIHNLLITPILHIIHYLANNFMPNCYLQTATGSFLDLIAHAHNLTRKPPTHATGHILFTKTDPFQNADIPQGTIIRSPILNNTIYHLKTTQAISIPPESTTALIPVIALQPGKNHNLGANYYTILDTPIPNILTITNQPNWITTPGADPEEDPALRLRIRNIFLATATWHTNAKYAALITQHSGIDIDRIYFDNTAPRGPGTANILILFDVADDSAHYLSTLQNHITTLGNHGHGDDILIKAITPINTPLTINYTPDPYLTPQEKATLKTQLENFIRCSFRQNQAYHPNICQRTYPGQKYSTSLLFTQIHNQFPQIQHISTTTHLTPEPLKIHRLTTLTLNQTLQ